MIIAKAVYISTNLLKQLNSNFYPISDEYIELIDFSELALSANNLNGTFVETRLPYFSIVFDAEPTEENLLLLTRVTFSNKFSKQKDKLNIFIRGVKSYDRIQEFLLNQGYSGIYAIDLEQMVPFKIGTLSGLIDYKTNQILLADCTFSEHHLIEADQEIVNSLALFSPTSSIIEQNVFLTKENGALKSQNQLLGIDLKNQKKYLEIALRQKETEQILNFYHKEYEVLPLWYKRIGHVVKAFMGKRSIASLFKN